MLWLSEVLIQNHDLENFQQFLQAIKLRRDQGERFLRMDVKPPFVDTPENWEEQVEAVFTSNQ